MGSEESPFPRLRNTTVETLLSTQRPTLAIRVEAHLPTQTVLGDIQRSEQSAAAFAKIAAKALFYPLI
jgi:hypothetical protein